MKPVKFTLFAALCCMSLTASAEAGSICGEELRSSSNTSDPIAYVKWETAANGDVNITVYKDGQTAWRGRGMADDVTKAKGWELLIDGIAVGDIADYFTKDYTSSSKQSESPSVYALRLKEGKTVPVGSVITYTPTANICWWTATDNNGWGKKNFEYTYGSTCSVLDAPTITSIADDGTITLSGSEDILSYIVNIYYEGALYATYADVHSGDKLPFHAVATADYTVGAVALSAELMSDESVLYTWHIEAATPQLGKSEICSMEFISDTYDGGPTNMEDSRIALSFNTIEGNVVVSIESPADDVDALFRNNDALGIGNFYINNAPATVFFRTNSKSDEATYILSLRSDKTLPVGTVITYQGTLQWKTSNFSNGYRRNTSLTYTYGTVCEGTTTLLPAATEQPAICKQLVNGQLVIIVGEQTFDATGKLIR